MKEGKTLLKFKQNDNVQEIKQIIKPRSYELMFIINFNTTEKERTELIETFKNFIKENNGEVIKVENIGEKDFAYPINKMRKGYYVLFDFKAYPDDVVKLQNLLKNNEKVIRFMVVRKNYKEE
jgi:small subunit ribosomal protein S6